MQAHSIYIHIPFCTHRCAYCDFNTYAGLESMYSDYVIALLKEIAFVSKAASSRIPVQTIFLGGGTPSLLASGEIHSILASLQEHFDIASDAEITMEANPGSLEQSYLYKVREAGINRLSIGMQSVSPEELVLLERSHSYPDVARAVSWARAAGINNINLDLIFGLPHQSLRAWQNTLDLALALNPDHISLYALSFEHGTPFTKMLHRGLLPLPSADDSADMYIHAESTLRDLDFEQYEISNWAKQDQSGRSMACAHNLQYWRNLPYFGFGAGAHGWIEGYRTRNVLSPSAYIERINAGLITEFPRSPATIEAIKLDEGTQMAETMMMALRLTQEGLSPSEFKQRFDRSLAEVYSVQIKDLIAKGLLEIYEKAENKIRLTSKGKLLGNQVFREFV